MIVAVDMMTVAVDMMTVVVDMMIVAVDMMIAGVEDTTTTLEGTMIAEVEDLKIAAEDTMMRVVEAGDMTIGIGMVVVIMVIATSLIEEIMETMDFRIVSDLSKSWKCRSIIVYF